MRESEVVGCDSPNQASEKGKNCKLYPGNHRKSSLEVYILVSVHPVSVAYQEVAEKERSISAAKGTALASIVWSEQPLKGKIGLPVDAYARASELIV